MHREMGQRSLAEALLPSGLGQNQGLERIDQTVDWEPLQKLVQGYIHLGKVGPAIRP